MKCRQNYNRVSNIKLLYEQKLIATTYLINGYGLELPLKLPVLVMDCNVEAQWRNVEAQWPYVQIQAIESEVYFDLSSPAETILY